MPKKLLALAGVFLVLSSFFGVAFFYAANQVYAQPFVLPADQQGDIEPIYDDPNIGSKAGFGNSKVKEIEKALVKNDDDGTQSQENTDFNTIQNSMAVISCGILGCLPTEGANGQLGYNNGLINMTTDLVVSMYNNPAADTRAYVADLLDSTGVQPAYAQGIGFSALDPVLEVWKIFRNIAYFFFVVAFMVIGMMIMFRQKISAQTVVTAQQAIPSIIVALLAVTFSYAIAGLLIDLMYIIMYLMVGLFGRNASTLIDGNFIQLGFRIIGGATTDVGEAVSSYISSAIGDGIIGGLAGIAGGVTAMLIFAIAIAIGIFRLFFNLLRRYVAVILAVAFAPIVLMASAIPGQSTFGPWLKGIIGNLAAFPILLMALIVADIITGALSGVGTSIQSGGFIPPYLGGSGTGGALPFIVGLGILLILSELVDKGAELLGAGKGPFDSLSESMVKNVREGWKGVGRAAEAQPFNFINEGIPFRTAGKETGLERLLVGSRAERKAEYRKRDEAAYHGKEYRPQQGGLASLLNARRARGAAKRQSGGGAGDAIDSDLIPPEK